MSYPLSGIRIDPQGQTAVVTFTDTNGNTATVYADNGGAATISLPDTITSTTAFYLPDNGPWTVSAKVSNIELAGQTITLEDEQVSSISLSTTLTLSQLSGAYASTNGTAVQRFENPVELWGGGGDGSVTDLLPVGGSGTLIPIIYSTSVLTIPTSTGINQQAEPCVVYVESGWNGWKFWMCMTPLNGSNTQDENASIVVSNDGINWQVPAGLTNPVIPAPTDPQYPLITINNIDPSIFLDHDGTMYLLNGVVGTSVAYPNARVDLYSSKDGVTWSAPTKILSLYSGGVQSKDGTPCLVWDGSQYRLYVNDSSATPGVVRYFTAGSPAGPWSSSSTACTLSGYTTDPNHINIQRYAGRYYMVIYDNTNARLSFAASDDGIAFTCAGPLVTAAAAGHGFYRSAFAIAKTPAGLGLFLWYSNITSTTWNLTFAISSLGSPQWTQSAFNGSILHLDGYFQAIDVNGANLFTTTTSTAWSDNRTTDFLELADSGGYVVLASASGSTLTRLLLKSTVTQFGNTGDVPVSTSVVEFFSGSGLVARIDQSGGFDSYATQTTLNGTTAGTAVSSQPFAGPSYKKFVVYLNGYENTTVTAQTITFPLAFAHTPYLAHDDSGGSTVSTTTLTLPASMGATKTGWIVVEGF